MNTLKSKMKYRKCEYTSFMAHLDGLLPFLFHLIRLNVPQMWKPIQKHIPKGNTQIIIYVTWK